MAKRLHYIDWLRVLAVLLLFPFHTSRVFNAGESFYVKSSGLSVGLVYVVAFIDVWHMPLLFLLAGASTFLALRKRTGGQYLLERVKRLLVPLVFGFFVLIPPQTWYGGRFNSGYSSSFWPYITSGDFLAWNIRDGGDYFGGFGIGHLWFILFLFLISLLALPLVLWGRSERGRARMERWARALAKPAWWLLPAVVLWITEGLPDLFGKRLLYYLTWFVLGFVVMHDGEFSASAERHRFTALGTGLIIVGAYTASGPWRDSLPDPSWMLTLVNVTGMLGAWTTVVGMLGVGKCLLDRPSPVLSYLAEASYPVYILHQTVIVVLAFQIVRWDMPWPLQWFALLAAVVAVTFGLYEIIRRVAPLRFLFGMRPAPKAREA